MLACESKIDHHELEGYQKCLSESTTGRIEQQLHRVQAAHGELENLGSTSELELSLLGYEEHSELSKRQQITDFRNQY